MWSVESGRWTQTVESCRQERVIHRCAMSGRGRRCGPRRGARTSPWLHNPLPWPTPGGSRRDVQGVGRTLADYFDPRPETVALLAEWLPPRAPGATGRREHRRADLGRPARDRHTLGALRACALVRTPPNETPPMMTRGPHMCRSAHCTGPVGTVRELLGVRGGAI